MHLKVSGRRRDDKTEGCPIVDGFPSIGNERVDLRWIERDLGNSVAHKKVSSSFESNEWFFRIRGPPQRKHDVNESSGLKTAENLLA